MKLSRLTTILLIALSIIVFPLLSHASDADSISYPKTDKRHYLAAKDIAYIRPGLNVGVTEDDIVIGADGSIQVTFSLTDDRGQPLDRDGNETPGPVRLSFVLSYIPENQDHYQSYFTRTSSSSLTGNSAVQATSDSGGSFERLADGVYVYTFGGTLPAGYDATATHTLGIYGDRNLGEWDLDTEIASLTVSFVPAGGDLPKVREIVTTESCHGCHDPLTVHGRRQGTDLCILCHYEGVLDPDTGNDVDFKQMIHKIHRGEGLPSVEAGTPYQIIGYRNTVHDYSHVVFPQDIRNCESCHTPTAAQSDIHLANPTAIACGSCHDDVNFATGENHVGGPQISDNLCAACHLPEGELEFDASVIGSHTIPTQSKDLQGLIVNIIEVMNTDPGQNPTVRFNLMDNLGAPIALADLNRLRLQIGGPTEEYEVRFQETVPLDTPPTASGNAYLYTFEEAMPDDAAGTFAIGAEARQDVVLNEGLTTEVSLREASDNFVFYFAVTDAAPIPRRTIVSDAKCENCHEQLSLHGGSRRENEYCVMCHMPGADDSARRPEDQLPSESIHQKYMIHRIHRGHELNWDYTIYGYGNRAHVFSEVLFPGDLRNCNTCHEGQSYQLPSAGTLPTLATENAWFAPVAPESAVCLSCHDSQEAAAHAFLQIAPFGEACATCHGPDAEFSVDRVHARSD